jgi:multicomponent Na+:H+ antiporter subunit D
MIDFSLFYVVITFLPAVLGFLGCVFPTFIFPVAIFCLAALSGFSLAGIFNGWEIAYRLMWIGGIEFSFDQYTYPLLFSASFSILSSILLFRRCLSHYFYQITLVLLTALMVAFSAVDLISIYIALELTGFCAFLLIADNSDKKSLFFAFQYLIGGGLAMLIYLIGVIGAYRYSETFLLADLSSANPTALCLIFAGLLTKSGIFLCGLWVPNIYSHVKPQSSAVLAGCVTCAGIAPIARMSVDLVPIGNSMVVIGVLSAVVAALYAVFERDDGRALGWSSVSQLGLAILSPSFSCLYAMQHGVCKTLLFSTLTVETSSPQQHSSPHHNESAESLAHPLSASQAVINNPLNNYVSWITFTVACLSVMAFPLTSGFVTKNLLKTDLTSNAKIIVSTSTLLTTTVYVRLIWSRFQTFLQVKKSQLDGSSLASFDLNQFYLLSCSCALVLFGFTHWNLYTFDTITNALTALILGIILYASVVGLQTDRFVKPITRTLDLVGAPFVVAALLLANLLYFKI